MIHISPWTDLEQSAANLADSGIALEVVLHPLTDIQKATEGRIRSHLAHVRSVTQGVSITVRADGLQVISSAKEDLKKIKRWVDIAQSILG